MKTICKQIKESIADLIPIIPTMDVVVFPNMIVPLLVLDERIIRGINKAVQDENKRVFLLASRKQSLNPQGMIGTKDLYDIGTIATIMRLIKLPDGGVKILVQGNSRARVLDLTANDEKFVANVECIPFGSDDDPAEISAQIRNIKTVAEKMSVSGQSLSPDFYLILSKMHEPEKIIDFILSHLTLDVEQAQKLLEATSYKDCLSTIYDHLVREIEVSEMQEKIKMRARDSMNKSQKEFYLREQLKAIKKELGDDELDELEKMRLKVEELPLTEEARNEITKQISRLEKTSPDSVEASVIRNYIDWFLSMPWGKETIDNLDLKQAQNILEQDHYGLKDIKEQILDFISVRSLNQTGTNPILCFFGPPGTGKTSLGKSIARSLGRNYFRVSFGGIKDEAEIRGHRRTYVGAMPGRFIQGIKRAGSCNPVIIIDELDKIASDFRSDPSAALLELLDPQQNKAFYDNYLGVPFDFSKSLFIATANNIETISAPLRDRMEIIQLSGYTLEEKVAIAEKYLVKRAMAETGISSHPVDFPTDIIVELINSYTREAGVRELERLIKKLCCKAARTLVENGTCVKFNNSDLEQYLGARKFLEDDNEKKHYIGVTNGLAWTAFGGELLKIEAVVVPGKGKLILTGRLGETMRESAQAALSYIRAHANTFGVSQDMFTNFDIHIHVPAGGIPKDGPSAGITMLSSILSVLTQRPINAEYAMTGELNLRGNVMPIGGVKEKLLAAKRNRINHVILPHKNQNDLIGLEEIVKDMHLILVDHADEVIHHVLLPDSSLLSNLS